MKITKVRDVKTPSRGTSGSAGIDFFIPNDIKTKNINNKTFIAPNESILIPSGIIANIPHGYMLTAFNKSGIASKKKLLVGAQVCDEDYQGEIHINLHNVGKETVTIEPGEKIVQFILVPVLYEDIVEVANNELFNSTTERGTGGFGHTGNK